MSLLKEIARRAPRRVGAFDVYLVGGGTAVLLGWRETSLDADLYSDRDEIFREIQDIKERLDVNVEFARPEHFVPPLRGAADRHIFIESIEPVRFFHYDPYSQVFSKLVRGFVNDARHFVETGLVDVQRLRTLVDFQTRSTRRPKLVCQSSSSSSRSIRVGSKLTITARAAHC